MHYRREIDGLRALAVIPVILFHAGFASFRGGFVGVDVFFVISGYLITSIIATELSAGRFSIVTFYERRARRILPALFLVMLTCVPFAWFWLLPEYANEFFRSVAAVAVFASNISFWLESGYFATAAELKPLLHTWSLAVEEQHYVLFPLFLLLLWPLGRRWVLSTLALLFVTSLVVAQWGTREAAAGAFFLLPTRAWELLIGAFVAFHLLGDKRQPFPRAVAESGALLGLVLIIYAIVAFDESTPFPGLPALVPTLGAALIILCASEATAIGRALGTPLLVGVGLISYSAYLWHQPMFAFARHHSLEEPSTFSIAGLALGSLGLAYLSWRFVEKPFRAKGIFTRRQVFAFAAVGSAGFTALGLTQLAFQPRYEGWWLARQTASVQHVYRVIDESREKSDLAKNPDGSHGDSECRFNVVQVTHEIERRIEGCYARYGEGIMIVGDSHAIDTFGVALAGSQSPFIVGITQGDCRPDIPLPNCQYEAVLAFVENRPEVFGRVIYEQAGFYLLRTEEASGSREMFSNLRMRDSVQGIFVDEKHVEAVHRYLLAVSRHVGVLWLGPRVEPHIGENVMLKAGCEYPYRLRPNQREVFEGLDDYIRGLVLGDSTIEFVSQNELFALEFPRDFMDCDAFFWIDGDHFSAAGERLFGQRIDLVERAIRTRTIRASRR